MCPLVTQSAQFLWISKKEPSIGLSAEGSSVVFNWGEENMIRAVSALSVGSFALLAFLGSAQAVTCTGQQAQDSISINVASLTSCTATNGNSPLTPQNGYVLIQDNTGLNATTGSFSPGTGYSSLELLIQTPTGQPHPDQFDIIFPDVASFTWTLLNGGDGKVTEAALYGTPVSYTPLPGALPLFATGLSALGLLGWRRKKHSLRSPGGNLNFGERPPRGGLDIASYVLLDTGA
jgi:hypothetical protein